MAQQQTAVANPTPESFVIPDSVTLNGQVFAVKDTPELKDLLEAVRKKVSSDERRKVYSQIDDLKKNLDQLQKVSVAPGEESLDNLKESILKEVKDILADNLSPVLDFVKEGRQDSVTSYRNKLLEENQGNCMPELVVGNTKEELDANLAKSIELFNNYVAKNGKPGAAAPAPTVPAAGATTPNPVRAASAPAPVANAAPAPLPTVPATPPAQPEELNLKSMSQEEFAKRRQELQAKIKALTEPVS
jgi:hypothetical protein